MPAVVKVTTPDTVPAAPSNLAAFARSSSDFDLTWTNNATNAKSFEIDRAGGGKFRQDWHRHRHHVPGPESFGIRHLHVPG